MWFDHDFVAAEWNRGKDRSIEDALEGFRGVESFACRSGKAREGEEGPNCQLCRGDVR